MSIDRISMGFQASVFYRPLRLITTTLAATMSSSVKNAPGVLEVAQFVCLDDNYGYLIHSTVTGETAAIDTPCGKAYKAELEKRGWTLTHILNT